MKQQKRLQEEMDFEIEFYEKVLHGAPDFIEALIVIGDLYTKKGWYEKGLEVDRKLSALRPEDPCILYNLACSYSLVNNIAKSLSTIKSAIRLGYDHLDHLEQDPDLTNLRADARFRQFLNRLRKKRIEQYK